MEKSKHFWKSKKRLCGELECAETNIANREWERDLLSERLGKTIKYLQEKHGYTIEETNKIMAVRGETV